MKALTASDLKYLIETNTNSDYFSRSNMRAFGDSMSNFGVSSDLVSIKRYGGEIVECYELYRRKPVKYGHVASVYFSAITFERIHGDIV